MQRVDNEQYTEYLKSAEWKQIAEQRLEIDNYRCQACECIGTPTNPLEVHHLSYKNLYNEDGRVYEDLVTLCHVCHKQLHKVMERVTSASGRRGWTDSARIPSVHVFSIDGTNINYFEKLEGKK